MVGPGVYQNAINGHSLAMPGASCARTRCGIILADSSLNPLYTNLEACRILNPIPKLVRESLQQQLSEITVGFDLRTPFISNFVSGRRHYICRVLPLEVLPELIWTNSL